MTAFVCPSCGSPLGNAEAYVGYTVTCKQCGKMVPVTQKRPSFRKQDKRRKPRKKGVLIAAVTATAAVILFALIGLGLKPSKTEFRDLNKDKADNEILTAGISALEDHGWTESETAFYIETRVVMYQQANKEASHSYRSRNSSGTQLTAKSTAADIKELSAADLRDLSEEIENRKIRIRKFEQILADFRKQNR
jgi:hypothetical protein